MKLVLMIVTTISSKSTNISSFKSNCSQKTMFVHKKHMLQTHYWLLWIVTSTGMRSVNWPIRHLTLYSPKPQPSVRQWRPFANNNEVIAHESW